MKKKYYIHFVGLLSILVLASCSQRTNAPERTDTRTSGEATIVVDETLMPIIKEQINVFEYLYPESEIKALYTSELDAYRLFTSDSIHYLIGTRPLTTEEDQQLKAVKREVTTRKLAIDGIAIIVNKDNDKTLMTLEDISDIVTGKKTNWNQLDSLSKNGEIQVVFDRPNSSTARFIQDSICHGSKFGSNVSAIINDDFLKIDSLLNDAANRKVIQYVENHKNAVGILGVNWISEPRDTTGLTFDTRINVVSINNPNIENGEKYYKPYAAYLGLKYYPLSRDVYVLKSDMYSRGIYSGLLDFMIGERGQRMVNKSGLFPANVPTRLIKVSTSMSDL